MMILIRRNMKVYFRDRSAVFFSLLSVLIIIGLYVLFLGNTLSQDLKDVPDAKFLINSWLVAGILTVASVTTTLGALGIMVEDNTGKVSWDFYASPIPRWKTAAAYVISSFLTGSILSLVAFAVSEGFLVAEGGTLLSAEKAAEVCGLLLLSSFAGSSLTLFLVSFLRSRNAYSAVSTIVGTLIGFLTGVYIPIGELPSSVQAAIRWFPLSHSASLMRRVLVEEPMSAAFAHAPAATEQAFCREMGITLAWNGKDVTVLWSALFLVGTALVLYVLAAWNLSRRRNNG